MVPEASKRGRRKRVITQVKFLCDLNLGEGGGAMVQDIEDSRQDKILIPFLTQSL